MKNYEPFGDEWKAGLMKMSKADIIEFYKRALQFYPSSAKFVHNINLPTEGEILKIITMYAKLQAEDSGQDGIDENPGNKSYLNYKARAIKELLTSKE